jgi:predicted Zn finger-like uncharacterized protein
MKFVCDRCQTKYSIADDRVRGKVLKVKCKTCGNVVTVREPGRNPSAAGLPSLSSPPRTVVASHGSSASHASAAAAAVAVPPIADTADESERTMLAPNPMLMEGFTPPSARRKSTGPLPPVASVDDEIVWYMALDGKRTGPFSKHQLVDKLAPLPRNADVHIWNEKLGDWKPPSQVPAVAADIAARKKAPPPPPLPGAPRRPTPPPPPTLASLGAAHAHAHAAASPPALASTGARRPTPHPPLGAPAMGSGAHPAHSKLPPPTGAGIQRPGLFSAAVPASAAPAETGDPLSLLETPAPQPHMIHPSHTATNGTGNGRASRSTSSDVLQMLNMPGTPQTSPGAAPRLMSVAPATTWTPSAESSARRNKSAQLILVLLGVVAVIIVVAVMGTMRSKKTVAPTVPETTAVVAPTPPPPEKEEPPVPPPPPPVEQTAPGGKGKLGKGSKTKPGVQAVKAGVAAPPAAGTPTTAPAQPVDNTGGAAARFRDGRSMGISAGVSSRPPPSQADITKVISNNRGNIKTCYQRALLRDNTLTHGKIAVRLSIGISGRVKHVGLDGPAQFKSLEPCIKEVVQRWVFPQASEEYGTEFPLVFQGNE